MRSEIPTAADVAVVVAHPDDETLWAGGTLLLHPEWRVRIVGLCRASDPDRAPRFRRVLAQLGAEGELADLDDGPEQRPLPEAELQDTIAALLGDRSYDLLLTHGPQGEYTRHRRHEEVSAAVRALWAAGRVQARELWLFAYEDSGGASLPQAAAGAEVEIALPPDTWEEKRRIVTDWYGFAPDSWEARTTPRLESFRRVTTRAAGAELLQEHGPSS